MKNKKILIAWVDPENKNYGVSALAYSALYLIEEVCEDLNIIPEFTFLGCYSNASKSLDINGKKILVNRVLGHNFFSIKGVAKFLLYPKKFSLKKVFSQDVIFDIAGGDSFSDIYGKNRFYSIVGSKKFYRLLRKTQVLLPQTIGPYAGDKEQKAANAIMNKMDIVMARDDQSYAYLQEHINPRIIQKYIDIAFLLPYNRVQHDTKKIKVGINVSGLLWNGGYTRDNQFKLKADYVKLMTAVVKMFSNNPDVQVYLIPHVIPEDDAHIESDYAASLELVSEFKNLILPPKFKSTVEAKSFISGLDFFMGARMHACIAAFSSGVPVLPMAYSRKFNGLFSQSLNYGVMADMLVLNEHEILEEVSTAFEKRSELKESIEVSNKTIINPALSKLKETIKDVIVNC